MRKVIFESVCQYCNQVYNVRIGEISSMPPETEKIKTYGICDGCMITHHIELVNNEVVNNLLGRR